MIYVSGEYALNEPCKLNTTGDWHKNCYSIENAMLLESNGTIFENYGLEKHNINGEKLYVADHIRAILDIMQYGSIEFLYGFKKDFICVDEYDDEIFNKVYMLKHLPIKQWLNIDLLMNNEYKMKWVKFKREKNG